MAEKRRRSQKKKARRRRPKPRGDWGHYFLQDYGVSVLYAAKANEDGSVEAALFGVDTWRDGLIACCGRRFETKEAFEEEMQKRSNLTRRSTRFRCREEIAYGLRIRLAAKANLPPEFDRWRHLVDPLDDVQLPPYIYRCPECGRGLPEFTIRQIREKIDGDMTFYLPCERCRNSRSRKKSVQHIFIKHIELIKTVEEIDEFSVTWDRDSLSMLTRIPIHPSYDEAVEMMISEGDAMRAASLAIECYIACASVPNRIVEDRHVLAALQAVIRGELVIEDEDTDSSATDFLVDAVKDGIDVFIEAMGPGEQTNAHVRSALREIETSANNHHSNRNPRAYIQFINQFVRV